MRPSEEQVQAAKAVIYNMLIPSPNFYATLPNPVLQRHYEVRRIAAMPWCLPALPACLLAPPLQSRSLLTAFWMDAAFSVFYLVYAFVFNWAYDLIFPI